MKQIIGRISKKYKEKSIDAFIYIILIYSIIILIKSIIYCLIQFPTIGHDEFIYFNMSQLPFVNTITLHPYYPILYPLFLYPTAFFTSDVILNYNLAKVFGILVSTSIVFPVYLLSSLYLKKNVSVLISLLSAFIPISFVYSFTLMAENIFYPLFFWAVYLLMKNFERPSAHLSALSGFFVALLPLSKNIGFVFLPVYGLFFLLKIKEEGFQVLKHQKNVLLIISVVLIPYYLWRGFSMQFNEAGFFGVRVLSGTDNPFNMFLMLISHFNCLILGSGFVFGILSLILIYKILEGRNVGKIRDFTIFSWISIILTLILVAFFMKGEFRIMSRYIAFLLPLIFIIGFKSLYLLKQKDFSLVVFSFPLILIAMLFFGGTERGELEIISGYSYLSPYLIYDTIIVSLILIPILYVCMHLQNKIRTKKIMTYLLVCLVMVLFIGGNIIEIQKREAISLSEVREDSIGKYLYDSNLNLSGTLIYDIDDYSKNPWSYLCIIFWTAKSDLIIDVTNVTNVCSHDKYVVSSKRLNYSVLTKMDNQRVNNVFLYKPSLSILAQDQ